MNLDARFRDAAVQLFREAFEGMPANQNYTWFVEGKEGIFDAFSSVSAEVASRKPSASCATIAAHAYHILFLLRCANMCLGRPAPEGTWESSSDKQAVTEAEWTELVARIHEEYELYVGWFSQNEDWTHEAGVTPVLAPLPHAAFHLGAIRQILRVVA